MKKKRTPLDWGQMVTNWGKTCKICLAKRGWVHLWKECLTSKNHLKK